MSGNHKNISGYSASDLQKYWRGELSAREMHELEKAALEDPFLADALEGMELHKALPETAAFDRDLEELQGRLEKRIEKKKDKGTILLFRPWIRVAVAVLLLAGLSTAAYYTFLNRSGQKDSVAGSLPAHKDKALPAPPVNADSTAIKTESNAAGLAKKITRRHDLAIAREEARQQKADSPRQTRLTADSLSQPDRTVANAQLDRTAANAQPDRTVANAEKDKAPDTQPSLPAMRVVPRVPSSARSQQLPDHLAFSGTVLDEHNHPLSGASVYLNGRSTVTDQHGVFNLKLRPLDSALKVTVGYVGYQQASIALNSLDQQNIIGNNIIRLQPQHSSLDEVVVVGYGTQRKETLSSTLTGNEEKPDSLWLKATPVSGRLIYQTYLAAAQKKLLLDSTIKGDEIISFDVNKKGELSSFRVDQSLSPAHDSSIVRLVREGPPWKLLRGRQARASVRVSF